MMKDDLEQVTGESYVELINNLGVSPLVGEKTYNTEPGYNVKSAAGEAFLLPYWDVIRRADDTYWSPLDNAERKTVYNVSEFSVQVPASGEWLPIDAWFNLQ
ncbi:MAG: hypothetical protein LBT80_08730 [Lactobacillaceae bacterium]|jgi:hypothetical protein|nr:hypothetical protein [Lactobacillaceae bacterium]